MAGWQVDPAGIEKIRADVAENGVAMGKALTSLSSELETIVTGTQSAEVQSALASFAEMNQSHASTIQNRIPNALEAVVGATNAILSGDEDMADATQSAAVASWTPEKVYVRPGTRMAVQ
jgi:hypothetical protein